MGDWTDLRGLEHDLLWTMLYHSLMLIIFSWFSLVGLTANITIETAFWFSFLWLNRLLIFLLKCLYFALLLVLSSFSFY